MSTIVKLNVGHLPAESRKMDKETALSELKAICTVISEPDGAVPVRYLMPWRGSDGTAFAVVAPSDIEQIQALISFAKQQGLRLLVQGERTGLVGASVPAENGNEDTVIVSMERYRSRLEYRESDRRVVVDSGYTLEEVNEFLKQYGVHIPIDVSSNPMIGGLVATNIGGSRVVRFGDARKLLMGVEVVLADDDQSIYSTLDKPRKDNSSPNFTGVFCGSFGSYGVITSASFEAFPIFSDTYTAWLALKPEIDISEVLKKIEDSSGDLLLACEFVSKQAVEVIASFEELSSTLPLSDLDSDLIFIEWGTTHSEFSVEQFAEKFLTEISETQMVEDIAIVPSAITWNLRHQFSDAIKKAGKLIGNDISVPRDRISQLRQEVIQAVKQYDPKLVVRDFGHLGDGGLHVNVLVEDDENISNWSQANSDEIRFIIGEIAVGIGGSFSAEHGLGSFNTQLYAKLTSQPTKKLNSSFKKICDPQNIFGHPGIVFDYKGAK